MTDPTNRKIRPEDLEAKFRELQGEVDDAADSARSYALMGGLAAAALVIILVFLFGRRKGKRRTTVVEVRRF